DLTKEDRYILIELNEKEMTLFRFTTLLTLGHFSLHLFYISGWFMGYGTYLKSQRNNKGHKTRGNEIDSDLPLSKEPNGGREFVEVANMSNTNEDVTTSCDNDKRNISDTSPVAMKISISYGVTHPQKKSETDNDHVNLTATQLLETLDDVPEGQSLMQQQKPDEVLDDIKTTTDARSTTIETSITQNSISRRSNTGNTDIADHQQHEKMATSAETTFLGNKFVRNVLLWSAAQGWEAKKKTKWHWWHTTGTG
ncbi:11497_t:CDS:1, partial [Acaulospora colombiana]